MTAKKQKPTTSKKQAVKTNDPEQSARFVKMAQEMGVGESGEAFDRAIGVLIPPAGKKPPSK